MADKYTIRETPEYKDFLESEFATKDLVEMENFLFGDTDSAIDEFFNEFPEAVEDNYIDLPNDNPFEEYDDV